MAAADSGSSAGSSREHFQILSRGATDGSGGSSHGVASALAASNCGEKKSSAGSTAAGSGGNGPVAANQLQR